MDTVHCSGEFYIAKGMYIKQKNNLQSNALPLSYRCVSQHPDGIEPSTIRNMLAVQLKKQRNLAYINSIQ